MVGPAFGSGSQVFIDKTGGQMQGFTLRGPTPGGFNPVGGGSIGKIVKAFTPAELLVQRLVKQRPKEGEETEARAIWGKPSNFQISDSSEEPDPGGGDIIIDFPKDDGSLDGFGITIPTLEFEEYHRDVHVVRIENPDDSDQYVMVERIDVIIFKGPDMRPLDAAGGLKQGVLTITDPETGQQFTALGIPQNFRLPYIYYKFTLHNTDHDAA